MRSKPPSSFFLSATKVVDRVRLVYGLCYNHGKSVRMGVAKAANRIGVLSTQIFLCPKTHELIERYVIQGRIGPLML
jgi:hypothetical protein